MELGPGNVRGYAIVSSDIIMQIDVLYACMHQAVTHSQ